MTTLAKVIAEKLNRISVDVCEGKMLSVASLERIISESLAAHSAKLQRLVTAAQEHLRSNSAASSVELSAALADMKEVENG